MSNTGIWAAVKPPEPVIPEAVYEESEQSIDIFESQQTQKIRMGAAGMEYAANVPSAISEEDEDAPMPSSSALVAHNLLPQSVHKHPDTSRIQSTSSPSHDITAQDWDDLLHKSFVVPTVPTLTSPSKANIESPEARPYKSMAQIEAEKLDKQRTAAANNRDSQFDYGSDEENSTLPAKKIVLPASTPVTAHPDSQQDSPTQPVESAMIESESPKRVQRPPSSGSPKKQSIFPMDLSSDSQSLDISRIPQTSPLAKPTTSEPEEDASSLQNPSQTQPIAEGHFSLPATRSTEQSTAASRVPIKAGRALVRVNKGKSQQTAASMESQEETAPIQEHSQISDSLKNSREMGGSPIADRATNATHNLGVAPASVPRKSPSPMPGSQDIVPDSNDAAPQTTPQRKSSPLKAKETGTTAPASSPPLQEDRPITPEPQIDDHHSFEPRKSPQRPVTVKYSAKKSAAKPVVTVPVPAAKPAPKRKQDITPEDSSSSSESEDHDESYQPTQLAAPPKKKGRASQSSIRHFDETDYDNFPKPKPVKASGKAKTAKANGKDKAVRVGSARPPTSTKASASKSSAPSSKGKGKEPQVDSSEDESQDPLSLQASKPSTPAIIQPAPESDPMDVDGEPASQSTLETDPRLPIRRVLARYQKNFFPATITTIDENEQLVTVVFDEDSSCDYPIAEIGESFRYCRIQVGDIIQGRKSHTGVSAQTLWEVKAIKRQSKDGSDMEKRDMLTCTRVKGESSLEIAVEKVQLSTLGSRISKLDNRRLSEEILQKFQDLAGRPSPTPTLQAPSRQMSGSASQLRPDNAHPIEGPRAQGFLDGFGIVLTSITATKPTTPRKHAEEPDAKASVARRLKNVGATIINDFECLFTTNNEDSDEPDAVQLRYSTDPKLKDLKIMLISTKTIRTPKYFLALALGVPCIHIDWVWAVLEDLEMSSWTTYMLGSGLSKASGKPAFGLQAALGGLEDDELSSDGLERRMPKFQIFKGYNVLVLNYLEADEWLLNARTLLTAMGCNRVLASKTIPKVDVLETFDYITVNIGRWNDNALEDSMQGQYHKVVSFEWVRESLIAGRVLSTSSYLPSRK